LHNKVGSSSIAPVTDLWNGQVSHALFNALVRTRWFADRVMRHSGQAFSVLLAMTTMINRVQPDVTSSVGQASRS